MSCFNPPQSHRSGESTPTGHLSRAWRSFQSAPEPSLWGILNSFWSSLPYTMFQSAPEPSLWGISSSAMFRCSSILFQSAPEPSLWGIAACRIPLTKQRLFQSAPEPSLWGISTRFRRLALLACFNPPQSHRSGESDTNGSGGECVSVSIRPRAIALGNPRSANDAWDCGDVSIRPRAIALGNRKSALKRYAIKVFQSAPEPSLWGIIVLA